MKFILKALNCNPTLAYIEKLGGTKKRGEKIITIEEFLQIFSDVKKEKEQGCYEDFIECLKLYDKKEDGKMLLAELSYALLGLGKCNNKTIGIIKNNLISSLKGEQLTQDQVDVLFEDCMGEENDDGEIEYIRK